MVNVRSSTLAALAAVAVADHTELLEDVERAIDRRGSRGGIDGPAAVDDLGAGHVAVHPSEHIEEDAALRRPAQAARPEPARDIGPARGPGGRCRGPAHEPPPNSTLKYFWNSSLMERNAFSDWSRICSSSSSTIFSVPSMAPCRSFTCPSRNSNRAFVS